MDPCPRCHGAGVLEAAEADHPAPRDELGF